MNFKYIVLATAWSEEEKKASKDNLWYVRRIYRSGIVCKGIQ